MEAVITKAETCVAKCLELTESSLSQVSLYQAGNSDQPLQIIKDLLAFYEEISDLSVKHDIFQAFKAQMRALLDWINRSRILIKTYHKSLDFQMPFA